MINELDYEMLYALATMGVDKEYHELVLNSQEFLHLKQALTPQPRVTVEEIVEELNELSGYRLNTYWDYDPEGKAFFYTDKSFEVYAKIHFATHQDLFNGDYIINTLPLELAHKITTFFTQGGNE